MKIDKGAPVRHQAGYAAAFLLLILIIAAIICGCTSAPSLPPPTPAATSVPLAEYHRSGGIAGIHEYLGIYENGTVISSRVRNGTITLNRSEISEIDALLREAPVISDDRNTTSSRKARDMMYYSVKYHGNEVKAPDSAFTKLTEILNRVPDK
jgi:hypothetical protein